MGFEANIYGIIGLIGFFQSFGMGIVLLIKNRCRDYSNLILGLSLITGAVTLLPTMITTTNLFMIFPFLIRLPYPFFFIMGGLSYLFVQSLTVKNFKLKKQHSLLIIPPLIGFFYCLPTYLSPISSQLEIVEYMWKNHNYPMTDWLIFSIALIYIWVMIIVSGLKIRRYRKALEGEYSFIQKIDLSLLTNWAKLFAVCWGGVTIISFFSFNRFIVDFSINMSVLFPAIFLIVFSYIGGLNMFQSAPLDQQEINRRNQKSPKSTTADSNELDEKIQSEFAIIVQEMSQNRHYLDPELTLPVLAEKNRFYRNELSRIINQASGTSFYHFINQYRIDHFKTLINTADLKTSTILDIAFQSGFNSKSAFYTAFKKITGKTPRQYLDSASEESPRDFK